MKRPERVRRPRPLSSVESLEARALMTLAATAPLPDLNVTAGAAVAPVDLGSHFQDPDAAPNFAIFDTTLGTIPVLLTPKTTPLTVANFLNYVNKGSYTNTIVHRSVPGFIWQAGGYQLPSQPSIATIPSDPAVQNEFGASNVRGTIAMAKLGGDPNSATSQFFFNESDSNAANLDTQNSGFTVFGKVIGASGLAVMDAIGKVPDPSPSPLGSPFDDIPLLNYTAGQTVQPSNLVLIKGVTTANSVYYVASDSPGVATAAVQGSSLTVTPLAAGTAHIMILGYGSDGNSTTAAFTVNVAPGTTPVVTPPATDVPTIPPAGTTTTPPATSTPQAYSIPPSDLKPTARGALPASVVAGQKAKIQQAVALSASAGPVSQKARVALKLSATTTGSPGDVVLASAKAKVQLKAGQQSRLVVSAQKVGVGVPAGTYHVLVSVTDPDGATTTVDTGKLLTVRAPRAKGA